METPLLSFQALTIFIIIFFFLYTTTCVDAQTTNTNTTSFSCPLNSTITCRSYVVYRAQQPDLLDTGHISDLFGVSRLLIHEANNLLSEDATFLPGQLLLIPISCGCSGNQSFANISYWIKSGDSFYTVSVSSFENLTDYHVVEELNPSLDPTKLKVGQDVTFPLYCKCPTKDDINQGLNFLLTYVWQRGDDISELSKVMNTSAAAIVKVNNYRNFTAAIAFPILIPVPQLPVFPPPVYNTTTFFDSKHKSGFHNPVVILSSVLGVALAVAFWSLVIFLYCKCRHRNVLSLMGSSMETADLLSLKKSSGNPSHAVVDKMLLGISTCLDNPILYDMGAIMEATMNLDDKYRIGTSVYKVTLNGKEFAVKKAKGDITEELMILQKLSHANLVSLRGVSADAEGEFFLVYEYVENGSLDKWLFPKSPSSSNSVSPLSWTQRINIALDIANGLQYIHAHSRPSIIHRDIRTSNILLNGRFKAKISNFSMAKPATVSVSPNIDVFAFGVILLELLSGKRDVANREGGDIGALWKEVRMILEVEEKREERLRKWMDPSLEGFYQMDGAMNLAVMARACTSEQAPERPSMSEIVFSLSLLAQSCNDEFERVWISNSGYNVVVTNPLVAR